jgi:hypothetical protein
METTTTLVQNAQVLIGKTIFAEGWHYDNGGMIDGVITEIERGRFGDLEYIVRVDTKNPLSMYSFTFKKSELEKLLTDGKLPTANKFLNTGTNAEIIEPIER